MTATALRPLLRHLPDARRSRMYLVDPVLFPYLALLFGLPIVVLFSCFNAAALRRWGLLAASLGLGVFGWMGFIQAVNVLSDTAFALIGGRAVNFAFGIVFYFLQRAHIRGHAFLGGQLVPLRPFYIGALVVAVFMPEPMARVLLGVPLG